MSDVISSNSWQLGKKKSLCLVTAANGTHPNYPACTPSITQSHINGTCHLDDDVTMRPFEGLAVLFKLKGHRQVKSSQVNFTQQFR